MKRLALSTLAAFVSIVVAVLVLTIADLYLVGHGYPSINQEVLSWPDAGVSMSLADIVMLLTGLSAGCITWFLMQRAASPKGNRD